MSWLSRCSGLFVCLALVLVSAPARSSDCTFVTHGTSVYAFCHGLPIWADARSTCNAGVPWDGGGGALASGLVVIDSAAENAFVASTASQMGMTRIWLGIFRISLAELVWDPFEGQPTQPVNYTSWAAGEPSNTLFIEYCGAMDTAAATWSDTTCLNLHDYVCELDCNDFNPCTIDSFDLVTRACVHAAEPCDDGVACTIDACDPAFGCSHTGTDAACDDGNPCTVDACNPAIGCTFTPAPSPCDDGNACTTGDLCNSIGACVSTGSLSCDDGNVCSADGCNPATGCTHAPQTGPCNDGSSCTSGDSCVGTVCVGAAVACPVSGCTRSFCSPVFEGSDSGGGGGAAGAGGGAGGGGGGDALPAGCEVSAPVSTWIDMSQPSAIFGTAITTGSFCGPQGWTHGTHVQNEGAVEYVTSLQRGVYNLWIRYASLESRPVDVYVDGAHVADNALAGTTASFCGSDATWALVGPISVLNAGSHTLRIARDPDASCCFPHMDDMLLTNVLDFVPPLYPAGEGFGPADAPTLEGAACDDGDICTVGDACVTGACVSGAPVSCDDGDPCTVDFCSQQSGCVNLPGSTACDDGNPCTTGDACTGGVCTGSLVSCDDGDSCTDDACVPGAGCVSAPNAAPCDDGNPCTGDGSCSGGVCLAGQPIDCGASPCATGACDPVSGCTPAPDGAPCDDGDVCTVTSSCAAGACAGGPAPDCDDGNPCTDDACVPGVGCVSAPNAVACDDGDACTSQDVCGGGACAGAAVACDDGNPCTTDGCDPGSGCTHAANSLPCDDGDSCTDTDTCTAGACAGSVTAVCDDGNPCTDDGCDASGCTHSARTGPCDDGNPCTSNDACAGKACAGQAVGCAPESPCIGSYCSPAAGCQAAPTILRWIDMTQPTAATGGVETAGSFCGAAGWTNGTHVQGQGALEYAVDLPAGVYRLWVRYASDSSRPVDVSLDGVLVADDALGAPTGSYCGSDAQWTQVASLSVLTPGSHTLRVEHDAALSCCFPHMDDILVTNALDFEPPPSPFWTAYSAADNPSLEGVPCSDGDVCTTGDACTGGACAGGALLSCDDGAPCTDDLCLSGLGCVHTGHAASCSDGNPCTSGDSCAGGVCVGGPAADCSDGSPCTVDACDPGVGCTHSPGPDGVPCEDGEVCTSGDTCGAGSCIGGVYANCDDGDPCTLDGCDSSSGCTHAAITGCAPKCTIVPFGSSVYTFCHGLPIWSDARTACRGGSPYWGQDPTTGLVVIESQAENQFVSTTAAALGMTVVWTALVKTPSGFAWVPVDGKAPEPLGFTAWNTGEPSNILGAEACGTLTTDSSGWNDDLCFSLHDYVCELDCDDGDPCTTDTWDLVARQCDHASGLVDCDDGIPCTADACTPGVGCTHVGVDAACNDGDPCTEGSCVVGVGCIEAPTLALCDDGDVCTVNDTCSGGACQSGSALSCDDGNPCTADSCDPSSGCAHAAQAGSCDDGSTCTTGDTCVGGMCAGVAVACPTTACARSFCVPENTGGTGDGGAGGALAGGGGPGGGGAGGGGAPGGGGVGTPLPDGCEVSPPVLEWIDMSQPSAVHGSAITDASFCGPQGWTDGTHVQNAGAVEYARVLPAGVYNVWVRYASETSRPVDLSLDGALFADNALAATTGSWCGTSATWALVGPVTVFTAGTHTLRLAHDADASCCFPHMDDILITNVLDFVPPQTPAESGFGVADAPTLDGTSCDDGDPCTSGDTCAAGVCVGGAATVCDDGDPCTVDLCDQHSGCHFGPTSQACDDGDACTAEDTCAAGACTGTPVSCDDGNVCTTDACAPSTGCTNSDNAAPCDDGNACTTGDTCAGGACVGGAAPDCDDGNVCTTDACAPSSGCTNAANAAPCDDGDACTTADTCAGGACVGGPAPDCDDGNLCTTDACAPATGCTNSDNSAPCDDGDACTTGDTCAGGACVGGAAPDCDDGNVCTTDSCAPSTGCTNTANAAPCDDGDACTTADTCAGGACVGGPAPDCDDGNPCSVDGCAPSSGCTHSHDSCPFGGRCLGEGESDCADDATRVVCAGGELRSESCGVDSCSDSGGAYGGGACEAVDTYCAAGECGIDETSGIDTCVGTDDVPGVQLSRCNAAGNACEMAGTTQETDSCGDSGSTLGGGSCLATDWWCADGVLSSSESSGSDVCQEGTLGLTYWTCLAGDGVAADSCVSVERTETESCVDSGTELGGGACAAVAWSCIDGILASTTTNGTDTCGGTPDDPTVTWHSCAADDGTPNRCDATVTTRGDGCSVAPSGGTCEAVDWACGDGTLASSATSSTRTCGDSGGSQMTTVACSAADGSGADTCIEVPDGEVPAVDAGADITVELASAAGTVVTLTAVAMDACDDALSPQWTESGDLLGTGAALTHTFSLGAHEVVVTVVDDSGNVSSDSVLVTVFDSCGDGELDGFDVEPPPCGKGKTKVRSIAELQAWLANPTTDLEIADDLELDAADLVIATRCDVKVKSKATLTASNVAVAAMTVDFGGDAVVTGRFELRAVDEVTVRSHSTVTAGSYIIEAGAVDEAGDLAASAKYCIESPGDVVVRQSSRSFGAGATVEAWAGGYLDVSGELADPGSVFLSAGERLSLREAARISDVAGSVTLQAGTDLDARGRVQNAGGAVLLTAGEDLDLRDDARVVNVAAVAFQVGGRLDLRGEVEVAGAIDISAMELDYREDASLSSAGDLSIVVQGGESVDWRGDAVSLGNIHVSAPGLELRSDATIELNGDVTLLIAGDFVGRGRIRHNGAVTIESTAYKLHKDHDFRYNASCLLTGAKLPGSKPAKGCIELAPSGD